MKQKSATAVIILFLIMASTAACKDKDVPQTNQENPQTNQENPYTYEDMSEEEYERAIEKMREEGILDENGQPAPGVDLNDYPGLG